MNNTIISKESNMLYHPTQKQATLTKEIEKILLTKENKRINLPNNTKLGGIEALYIEIDPQEYGIVLVHWKPNFNISTQTDPFCSSLILKTNTLQKLLRVIQ